VLALDESERLTVLRPPADAFFDSVIELEPWSVNELVQILERRNDSGQAPIEELVMAAATGARGNPREAIRALNDAVVHGWDPSRVLDARGQLLDRASEQGRPAAMLMGELLQRGMASPSDEDLQQSLGVTRARLNQLFRQLLEQDLVKTEIESSDGPGRPRTIYRPALSK
jgi:hypothetical protein